ncbi:MAG TPA: tetratricopeptide repeat protein [Blastocatellia bacterium]|nr:tetratricopeptide repeat protein [Blastocatellia bacterium]
MKHAAGRTRAAAHIWGVLMMLCLVSFVPAQDARSLHNSSPEQLAARFKEATEAQRQGRFDDAAAAYADVLKMRPNLAEAYVNYGLVRHEQRQFSEAVKLFEKALALKPSLANAHLFLGISYYSLNQFDAALKALVEATRLLPQDARAWMWLGVAEMAADQPEAAAKHLDQAAALQPTDIDILYHRGRAHFKLSQASYQQMFKLDPKSVRVHQVLAQSYQEAGREADAIAEYELALKAAPTLPGVREALGSLYWKNNRMDEAEKMFEQELQLDPHNALVMYKAGSMRVERGQPERGLPLLEAAVKQHQELIDAYYYLGKAQALLNQNDAALVHLKRAIDGGATRELVESSWYQLARLYRKLGRSAEAQTAMETFQQLRQTREHEQAEKLEELKKKVSP